MIVSCCAFKNVTRLEVMCRYVVVDKIIQCLSSCLLSRDQSLSERLLSLWSHIVTALRQKHRRKPLVLCSHPVLHLLEQITVIMTFAYGVIFITISYKCGAVSVQYNC